MFHFFLTCCPPFSRSLVCVSDQANKAEKSAVQELAKHGADHAEQLQELGAQLGHFAQSGAHAQAQV